MSDGNNTPQNGNRFDALDPRLTVFALANGMDLAKDETSRRLEWFAEGLERGILIEHEADAFSVSVVTWKTGNVESLVRDPVGDGLSAEDVGAMLSDSIDRANGLSL